MGLKAALQQLPQHVDRSMFKQGWSNTAELLSTMTGVVGQSAAAREVIGRLRASAEDKPLSYAAGVESLLMAFEAALESYEGQEQPNVTRKG